MIVQNVAGHVTLACVQLNFTGKFPSEISENVLPHLLVKFWKERNTSIYRDAKFI